MRDCPIYPQVMINVPVVRGFRIDEHPSIQQAVADAEKMLGETGRVVLRASGTEPLIRVMVEGHDEIQVGRTAEQIAAAVRSAAGV